MAESQYFQAFAEFGGWVSKTVGSGFKSLCPCQTKKSVDAWKVQVSFGFFVFCYHFASECFGYQEWDFALHSA